MDRAELGMQHGEHLVRVRVRVRVSGVQHGEHLVRVRVRGRVRVRVRVSEHLVLLPLVCRGGVGGRQLEHERRGITHLVRVRVRVRVRVGVRVRL